MVVYLLLSDNS